MNNKGTEQRIYNSLSSYEDYCIYGYLIATNQVKYHPFWNYSLEEHNLVESEDNIREYIPKFNLAGFYTRISQPSINKLIPHDDNNWTINRCIMDSKLDYHDSYSWKQRAYVCGVMKRYLFDAIKKELINDSRLYVAGHSEEKISVYFPITNKGEFEGNIIQLTMLDSVTISATSDNLWVPDQLIPGINVEKEDLVSVDIIDKEFGNNDEYIFKKLLNLLEKYTIEDYETKAKTMLNLINSTSTI